MYVRTKDGLGQGQAPWSTHQTFNRPTAQPAPIGYLGNFNGHMGKAESEPCKLTFVVGEFGKDSHTLSGPQKKDIKDIATAILRSLNRDLKGKSADITLKLLCEGHVDANTDRKQYGDLDEKRAIEVGNELADQITNLRWKIGQDIKGLTVRSTYSRAGSTRPRKGATSKQNRRVVVCARWQIESP